VDNESTDVPTDRFGYAAGMSPQRLIASALPVLRGTDPAVDALF
jgi:hypothetical protein